MILFGADLDSVETINPAFGFPLCMQNKQKEYRRLYHFVKCDYAIQDIQKRRLKISTFENLNDPFELQAAKLSHEGFDEFLVKEWRDAHGLLCFCSEWSNPVMWAHYAEGHRGIVLGLDVLRSMLTDVSYVAEPKTLVVPEDLIEQLRCELEESGNPSNQIVEGLNPYLVEKLATKHKGWAYEKETRSLRTLADEEREDGLYFKTFGNGVYLREVILGERCSRLEAEIKTLIADFPKSVSVKRARLDPGTFKVCE